MDFFDFTTAFDLYNKKSRITRQAFAQEAMRQLNASPLSEDQKKLEMIRFQCEDAWTEAHRPYFKIWPEVISTLTEVTVDVPVEYLKLPFPAIVIRLPKTGSPLAIGESLQIRSLLVTDFSQGMNRFVYLWVDIGETEPNGFPMLHWSRLDCLPGTTIEKSLNENRTPNLPGVNLRGVLVQKCLRLAVSVCFLSTGTDRLVQPDVLSKDLQAYIEARRRSDQSKVREIEQRAERRKGKGWNVGQHERLRPVIYRNPADSSQAESMHQLTHQHQRRAHFRLLPSGAVAFVRQATVRPDLPVTPTGPAYFVR